MKAENACIPCIMKQAYNTAVRATDDETLIRQILEETADYVKTVDLSKTPADSSNFAYMITKKITGNSDPYKEDKKKYNTLCLEKVPELRTLIEESDDPLKTAVRLAILGNVIDMGIGYEFDLDGEIDKMFQTELATDDYDIFKRRIESGRLNILFLGDNGGEIVFDTLLVDMLRHNHDVTYVVKSGPIINDSTMEDAEFTGMTDMVKVIETGSDGIGVRWDAVSDEFIRHYENADIIISKGQGNFETMSDRDKETYFLLKAKCDTVAAMLGVKFSDVVFRKGPVK